LLSRVNHFFAKPTEITLRRKAWYTSVSDKRKREKRMYTMSM